MKAELLEQLRKITPEEQEILNGRKQINEAIYVQSEGHVFDSRKLLDASKLITVRPHTRFVHFPKHTHNYVEVIYMCSGQTRHLINEEEVILRQGELLFLSQKATQEIDAAGENDIGVNFIILPEFFDKSLQMMGEEQNPLRDFIIGCLRGEGDNDIGYLHFKVADVLPVQNLVENLIWTLMHNQPNKRSINQVTMGLLFLQLLNHTDKVVTGNGQTEEDVVLSILRFVEEHYRDGELTELAQSLHYDLYWLSRMIKKRTGKTYTELIQQKRMQQAAFLLRSTDMPVSEVGNAVGYDNLSYFHKIFRKQYAMSPKKYKSNLI